MRWQGRRGSDNVVDRRGARAGLVGGTGLVVALLYFLFTGDPGAIIQQGREDFGAVGERATGDDDAMAQFVGVVLADTEDVWNAWFAANDLPYAEPQLVLFNGTVSSACGMATSAVGPFYCPGDKQVFIDLDFFGDLDRRLGAKGDFAQAYVIAHEVGHHVQNLLGLLSTAEGASDSVEQELMADCLAGVWAARTDREKHVLEAGDLDEALGAAEAVGDDRLQMQTQGRVVPDSFTHGTSAQRRAAFEMGFARGDPADCGV